MLRNIITITITLVAVLAVLALGSFLLGRQSQGPRAEFRPTARALPWMTAPGAPAENLNAPSPSPLPTAGSPQTPTLATRDDLAALLAARGLPAERLITAWADWRRARGFLDNGSLAGPAQSDLGIDYYYSLEPTTLKNLAAAGDTAALLLVAARNSMQDQPGALEELVKGSYAGSAQTMLAVGETFLAIRGTALSTPEVVANARVVAVRRGKGDEDLRVDALAWNLAAIRQYGPAIVEPAVMSGIEKLEAQLPPEDIATACEQSLAIYSEHQARQVPGGDLPPVFVMPADLYARLPCLDGATAMNPPPDLARCESVAATDGRGAPAEVLICSGP